MQRCSDRVDFHADDGDSGSPVFDLKSNGTIELRGIVFGWKGSPYSDAVMSDLHQIELDLGGLMVIDAPLNVNITGVVSAPPNTNAQWCANVSGGRPPYSYEWRRDGSFVDSGECYFGNTGFASFTLTVEVTDGEGSVDTDSHFVTVEDGPELVGSSQ